MSYWILVANSSFAQIFEVAKRGVELKEVHRIDFPEGRERSGEILSDRAGRTFQSMGDGTRSALGTEINPHLHEQQVFAHKIGEYLQKAQAKHAFEKLAIIAPPQFLGLLRNVLPERVTRSVIQEVHKEVPNDLKEGTRLEMIRNFLDLEHPSYTPRR